MHSAFITNISDPSYPPIPHTLLSGIPSRVRRQLFAFYFLSHLSVRVPVFFCQLSFFTPRRSLGLLHLIVDD